MARFGARLTVLAGSIIATTGFFTSSLVNDLCVFFLTYGVIAALGISCVVIGSLVPLYEYFDKHKAVAIGVLMAGFSLGYFMWPPLVTVLFSHYGWRGSFMILAGLQLQTCVLGACLRPFRRGEGRTFNINNKTSACSDLLSQVKVFQNKHFMLFTGSLMLFSFGYSFAPVYLPVKAERLRISKTDAALLVSYYGKPH